MSSPESEVVQELNLIEQLADRPYELRAVFENLTDDDLATLCSINAVTPICEQDALDSFWLDRTRRIMPAFAGQGSYGDFRRVFTTHMAPLMELLTAIRDRATYTATPAWGRDNIAGMSWTYRDVPTKVIAQLMGVPKADLPKSKMSVYLRVPLDGEAQLKVVQFISQGGWGVEKEVATETLRQPSAILQAFNTLLPYYDQLRFTSGATPALKEWVESATQKLKKIT